MEGEDRDLQDAVWDLEPLVYGQGEAGARKLMTRAEREGERFADRWRGRVRELSAAELAQAIRQYERLREHLTRAYEYAYLRWCADTQNAESGALLQEIKERAARLGGKLVFFELEWAKAPEAHVRKMMQAPELAQRRKLLANFRIGRRHWLSEAEERIIGELSVSGGSAWRRLFDEQLGRLRVTLDRQEVSLEEALACLSDPDRRLRRRAAYAVSRALGDGLEVRAFCYNTVLGEHATLDRLRGRPHWLHARNLANEISGVSVQALVQAVRERFQLAQDWYALKAKLLGLRRLEYFDRNAPLPLPGTDRRVSYAEARRLVVEAYERFSPKLGKLADRFFCEGWIHAPVRPGKLEGAFCAYTVPSLHPYVMVNFTGRMGDVLTLAHELGHGVHAYLAREHGISLQSPPLTVCEAASVFGEYLCRDLLLEDERDPATQLSLLGEALDGAVAAVFRQIALHAFEERCHTHRRTHGELSLDDFQRHWLKTQRELLGDSVAMDERFGHWWSYIPHFIHSPGYVYAYAYGQLFALVIYQRWREEGKPMVAKYLRMLSAGGSLSPRQLGELVGCDLDDPQFWRQGLDLLEEQLDRARRLAAQTGHAVRR